MAGKAVRTYGLNACLAVLERRPGDVERLFLTEDRRPLFGDILRARAQRRRPYKIVATEELNRVADSVHHEGACLFAAPLEPPAFESIAGQPGDARLLLYLDRLQNPHNLGAVLRVAANFGVAGVLSGHVGELGPAARRVAEGAAEHVPVVKVADPVAALTDLRAKGFQLVGTLPGAQRTLYGESLPPRLVLLIGAEREGLSQDLQQLADYGLAIPGTGAVQSLNVACAVSVLCGEYARLHGTGR